ncbi:MAG TPA: 6-carboxytetrahydropterin synthase [Saprospiraceae bacterium]|nr:MAG: 6-pyruvoyl-tetrahydropterin synthase [Candidatus Parvibacillus calidus]MCC7150021.1 6-carboxytetrahydropterin synthase [Saprospiraceae bacterium]MCO5282499.1 6-carboxytetrahydropterin synthase [Saprospiraceae bacterium]WKZ62592.1 MAG: 6-carboxytetrahydropterin synthase [Saprospiraceae bacterium]HRN34518.1 6-carboxytetrahydropterin synthase [Saprospiraceae bacterium]
MIVAKTFKWEAAHRLPRHEGKCKHIHGHSYKMTVEFEGEPNANGMVIDFNDIKKIIQPHIDNIDHSTMIAEGDDELKEVFDSKSWRYFLLPFDSTAENLCRFFLDKIILENRDLLAQYKITAIGIKVFETGTSFAYARATL